MHPACHDNTGLRAIPHVLFYDTKMSIIGQCYQQRNISTPQAQDQSNILQEGHIFLD
jgi:hypothetical protein